MSLELVRCLDCSLVYAPYPESSARLAELYAEADYDSSDEADAAAATYARELAKLPGFDRVPRESACDIGAGNGALLTHFAEMGFDLRSVSSPQ